MAGYDIGRYSKRRREANQQMLDLRAKNEFEANIKFYETKLQAIEEAPDTETRLGLLEQWYDAAAVEHALSIFICRCALLKYGGTLFGVSPEIGDIVRIRETERPKWFENETWLGEFTYMRAVRPLPGQNFVYGKMLTDNYNPATIRLKIEGSLNLEYTDSITVVFPSPHHLLAAERKYIAEALNAKFPSI